MMTAERPMHLGPDSQADGTADSLRFPALAMRTPRLFCKACDVFAAVQLAGRRKDASPIYAVASLCEVCRWNYIHATQKP